MRNFALLSAQWLDSFEVIVSFSRSALGGIAPRKISKNTPPRVCNGIRVNNCFPVIHISARNETVSSGIFYPQKQFERKVTPNNSQQQPMLEFFKFV